jgi:hypothetical protein
VTRSWRLKLTRAIEHLYSLQVAVERWAQTDPCVFVSQAEIKTRKHGIYVNILHQPTDSAIPLLIGDCAHNARQCLDHLAYQLAIFVSKTDPPPNEDTSEFPIMGKDRHQFDSALAQKIAPKKTIPSNLYTLLERLQPYNGGETEALAILHRLDNTDKHRFPPIVAGIGNIPRFNIGHLSVSQIEGPRVGAIEHGAPVIEFTPMPGSPVNMDFQFAPSIAFDKRSPVAAGQPVLPVLDGILGLIARSLPEFEAILSA